MHMTRLSGKVVHLWRKSSSSATTKTGTINTHHRHAGYSGRGTHLFHALCHVSMTNAPLRMQQYSISKLCSVDLESIIQKNTLSYRRWRAIKKHVATLYRHSCISIVKADPQAIIRFTCANKFYMIH